MGRKKKTLHDYAAEFSDLAVKRHVVEQHESGERTLVELLYCRSCGIPMRVRRDRILEHLASARHYRNRRLIKQQWERKSSLITSPSDLQPVKLDSPHRLVTTSPCISITSSNPHLISQHQPALPLRSTGISSTSSAPPTTADDLPSTSAIQPKIFSSGHVKNSPVSAWKTSWLMGTDTSSSVAVRQSTSAGPVVRGVGLALFGVSAGCKTLCQSLVEEGRCQLLYVVEDQRWEVENVFSQEQLSHIRILRSADTDIVLSDQRVLGIVVCSPPDEASVIIVDALRAGGVFFHSAVHDIDVVCWLLGEHAPDTIFTLGHAFCAEMAAVNDADSVSISMKFQSGAVASLDISQHCHKSCDQKLEVHGSEGSLHMDNRNPLGISDHSTSASLCLQATSDRYRDAYRELIRHYLRTLIGKESPFFTKEQYLWTIQVAAAAEQSWRNGTAVDLRSEAVETSVIKTEVP
ncbi:T73AS protein, partial [Polypterus senegalus]